MSSFMTYSVWTSRAFLVALVSLAGFFSSSRVVSAATPVSGALPESTVWTLAESPYLVSGPFTIPEGYTLSVEPGVVIKVAGPSYGIFVSGTFDSKGTADSPVTITSFQDDTAGGDTNGDGGSSTPAPGDWAQIRVMDTGTFRAEYTKVRYGGSTTFRLYGGSSYPLIWNAGGILSISNTILSLSADRGVYQEVGVTTISESIIRDNAGIGYEHAGGSSRIKDSVFSGQSDTALFGQETGTLEVTGSLFRRNGHAIALDLFKALSFIHSGNTISESPRAAIELSGNVSGSHRFTNEGIPYLITSVLHIMPEALLTLDPGVVIKMEQIITFLQVSGALHAQGAADSPITITSFQDDTVGGDTNGDGRSSTPAPGDWQYLRTRDSGVIRAEHFRVLYGGNTLSGGLGASLIWASGSELSLLDATLLHSGSRGVYQEVGVTTISESIIRDNAGIGYEHRGGVSTIDQSVLLSGAAPFAVYNPTFDVVDARGNWWGSETGPTHPGNPLGTGSRVSDRVRFTPWLSSDPFAAVECCSSVAFIPGLEASRLYRPGVLFENQLWEPNTNTDVRALALDPITGESVNADIYTDDVIDEAFSVNIYKNFLSFMENMATVGDIADFETFPYDWRFDVKDVVNRAIMLRSGSYEMIPRLRALAAASQTGKVTLIAHSNGGLVAKELLNALKDSGEENLVDKIILVATPELGTPKAVLEMLHGMEPFAFNFPREEVTRELAENMKSAYTLLPSAEYFNQLGVGARPLIEFSTTTLVTLPFRGIYGETISNYGNLRKFILGDNGARPEPSPAVVNLPNVLKWPFLTQAETRHTELDFWQPPVGVDVVRIIGWGLETPRGIVYKSTTQNVCNADLSVCSEQEILDPELLLTAEGDGTVVYVSADALGGERYYVDINKYNDAPLVKNRDHKSILEIEPLQDLVSVLVKKEATTTLPAFTFTEKPNKVSAAERLRIGIHSPVVLHIYDSLGRHTGPIPNPDVLSDLELFEEQIPNSYYWRLGEGQYAGAGGAATTTVKLVGTALGSATVGIERIIGDETITSALLFEAVPITAGGLATIDVVPNAEPTLLLDVDGDGIVDAEITTDGFTSEELVAILKSLIKTLDLPDKREKQILKVIDKLEKELAKEHKKEKTEKLKTEQAFKRLLKLIEQYKKKKILSADEAGELISLIEDIRSKVVK